MNDIQKLIEGIKNIIAKPENLQFFKDNDIKITKEFQDILIEDHKEVVKFINKLKEVILVKPI